MRIPCVFPTLFYCATLASSPLALAHHSPSEVIESLSHRINQGERNATVFVRRGDEFRALGDYPAAVADYNLALHLRAENFSALYGMAQAHFRQSHWDEAQAAASRGLASTSNAEDAATFHAIIARIHEQHDDWEKALDSWQQTLESSRPNVDWYLGESRSLQRLNKVDKARQALVAAMKRNPSIALQRAWIKTLIESDEIDEAEKQIAGGLKRTRWKSSWLLLRARLRLAQHQTDAARHDAQAALNEINRRQSPGSVNPFLVADREFATHILGRAEDRSALHSSSGLSAGSSKSGFVHQKSGEEDLVEVP